MGQQVIRQLKEPSVAITLLLIIIAVFAYLFIPDFKNAMDEMYDVFSTGDKEKIQNWLDNYKSAGPYILLAAFLIQMFLFLVPSVLVMSLCILMYGKLWGSLLCLGGIFIASSLAYVIGSTLSRVTIDKLIGHKSRRRMESFIENYGFWTVFVFRLSPFLSNDAVSFAGGLTKMNYGRFIAATLLGIIPLIVLLAWLGSNTEHYRVILLIIGIISLVGLFFYIYMSRRNAGRKQPPQAGHK